MKTFESVQGTWPHEALERTSSLESLKAGRRVFVMLFESDANVSAMASAGDYNGIDFAASKGLVAVRQLPEQDLSAPEFHTGTPWTLSGGFTAISGDQAVKVTGANGTLSQANGSLLHDFAAANYTVLVDVVSVVVTGTLNAHIGGNSGTSQTVNADGRYTFTVLGAAGAAFSLSAGATSEFRISRVVVTPASTTYLDLLPGGDSFAADYPHIDYAQILLDESAGDVQADFDAVIAGLGWVPNEFWLVGDRNVAMQVQKLYMQSYIAGLHPTASVQLSAGGNADRWARWVWQIFDPQYRQPVVI